LKHENVKTSLRSTKSANCIGTLREKKTVAQIASEYGIHPNQLYRWKKQTLEGFPRLFEGDRKAMDTTAAAHEQQLNYG